jgi:pyoverdine/dityrosine biosynthesis protein Dit1
METLTQDILTHTILTDVLALGNFEAAMTREHLLQLPIAKQITKLISLSKPLIFILPAFPAKSANRQKTIGPIADMGEVIALNALEKLCQSISQVYNPGAKVLICSDGHVFNDLVFVSEADLTLYQQSIEEIISDFKLRHLLTYNLKDHFEIEDPQTMRELLIQKYGTTLEIIKIQVNENQDTQSMFNGLHRFVTEDIKVLKPALSKSQMSKQAKSLAYQVIQRSRAWDQLLEEKFPQTIRLSIHPYPLEHKKFGVKLVKSSDRWATPWHNSPVLTRGQLQLMSSTKAKEMGANLEFYRGKYAYFSA